MVAFTGSLALLVLLMLPLDYVRYRVKRAYNREVLKNAVSKSKKSKKIHKKTPFMGTPNFSKMKGLWIPSVSDLAPFSTSVKTKSSSEVALNPHLPPLDEDDPYNARVKRKSHSKKKKRKKKSKEQLATDDNSERIPIGSEKDAKSDHTNIDMARPKDYTSVNMAIPGHTSDQNHSFPLEGQQAYFQPVALEDDRQKVFTIEHHLNAGHSSNKIKSIDVAPD